MSTAGATKPKKKHTKLHYCDIDVCEGICCSDGAFLGEDEVKLIHKVVAKHPEHFAHLPKKYIVDGEWQGQTGPQTNIRKHVYRNKPEHFANTRCVFTEADGKCSLQTLAVKQGVHKWKYKPMGCWLFPLMSDDKGLVAPPRTRRDDPNNLGKEYPGFSTITPCGKHSETGKVWWIALKEEVAEYRK
jgi:hypothetical protein